MERPTGTRLVVVGTLVGALALPMCAAADSLPEPNALAIPLPAIPQTVDCDAYARAYADSYLGSGDPTGDIIEGGMRGAVAGGAWQGPSGERRGARVGGALAVLDNLAAYPGGWQGLYDMALQICENEHSGATYRPAPDSGAMDATGRPGSTCRSSAGMADNRSRDGLSARSGTNGCP